MVVQGGVKAPAKTRAIRRHHEYKLRHVTEGLRHLAQFAQVKRINSETVLNVFGATPRCLEGCLKPEVTPEVDSNGVVELEDWRLVCSQHWQ